MKKKIFALFFLFIIFFLFVPSLSLADERCPDYCADGIFYSGRTYDLRAETCSGPTNRQTCDYGCDGRDKCAARPATPTEVIPTQAPVIPTLVPTTVPPTAVPTAETRPTIQVPTNPEPTSVTVRDCPGKCENGTFYSEGSYDSRLAECQYKSEKKCVCDTGGRKCKSSDCSDYCSGNTAYTGAIKAADGSCKYPKQEKCKNGCDPTGKGCLGKVCQDKCTGSAYHSGGYYEDEGQLVKGCVYKDVVQCALGCDPAKKECQRCSADADCKNSCKLGVLSVGKCDQNATGSGCLYNQVTCSSAICSPLKSNLCGLKIGPAYFNDPLDGNKKPIPEARVLLTWAYVIADPKGGKSLIEEKLPERATDADGNIILSKEELYKYADNPDANLTVTVSLEDFKKRFFIKDVSAGNAIPFLSRTIYMNKPETYSIIFNFNKPPQNRINAKIYYHNWEAMRFGEDILKVPVNYLPPESIEFNNAAGCVGACHNCSTDPKNPSDDGISYDLADSALFNTNSAENLEWHEFCHHIMVDEFNYMPWDYANCNHCGYANPNSGDSWIEGWAEFCALAIKDNYKYFGPDIYSLAGSMEVNYKVTVNEEFAVASALWDLYDPVEADGVQLSIQQIWNVLKGQYVFPGEKTQRYIHNFREIYWAFNQSKLPGLMNDINNDGINNLDDIFIVRDCYIDENKNLTWNLSEPIGVTLWSNPKKAGPAVIRPNRPLKPGAYLKISLKDSDNKGIQDLKAKIKVTFQNDSCGLGENCDYEYWAPIENGKVYVEPPTEDFEATVEIEVFSGEKSLPLAKFAVKDYWQKYDAKKDFVQSYELKVDDFQNIPETQLFLSDVISEASQEKVLIESSELTNGVYKMNGFRKVKLFRIISMKMKVQMEIDSQTGNILKLKKPWWSFLAYKIAS